MFSTNLTAESLGAPACVENPPAKARMSPKEMDEAWYLNMSGKENLLQTTKSNLRSMKERQ